MINGGYKIISLSSPTIHDDIENNYLKAIMLTDIIIDGVEKPDIFVSEYSVDSGNFVFDVYDKTVTVTADNEVTYTEGGKHLYLHYVALYGENEDGDSVVLMLNVYNNKSSITIDDIVNNSAINGYVYSTYEAPYDKIGIGFLEKSVDNAYDFSMNNRDNTVDLTGEPTFMLEKTIKIF